MIVLNGSTESLVATLGGANAHHFVTNYLDLNPGARLAEAVAGTKNTSLATTNETAVVSAPSAGFIRIVKSIFVRNTTANSTTVQFAKDVSGTNYNLGPAITLASGEGAFWSEEAGWVVYITTGQVKPAA